MKHKYSRGDAVLIYNCKEFVGGGAGTIQDRDAESPAYLVIDVANKERTVWIHEENLMRLNFVKPKNLIEKIIRALKA